MEKIVIVEDDPYLREELLCSFQKAGYDALGLTDFDRVEEQLRREKPDLVVLDVNLPKKTGYELCKSMKGRVSFPILILTARDTLTDELTALQLGADDFLTKPCHPQRLLARAERLLATYEKLRSLLTVGPLSLDTEVYRLSRGAEAVTLPETEGRILALLMERYPNFVEKRELFQAIWGTEEYVDENILQVNMSRLRKNLTELGLASAVRNIRGKGYVLEVEP